MEKFHAGEKSVYRRSEIPASPTCPETLKIRSKKIAESIFLAEKNWQCRVVLAARSRRYRGTPGEGIPPSRVGDFVWTLQVATRVHADNGHAETLVSSG